MNYELHPLCTLFPRLGGAEFSALVADIKANGLRVAITLHDGMILDGGNRYRACLAAGIEPRFVLFNGTNLVSFVLSANLHRRHMTAGQQAAIVASAQDWAKSHSKGGDRRSDQSATLHFDSAAGRAAESGASLRTQKMADKVAKADPALAKQVAHGEVSLPRALAKVEGRDEKPVRSGADLPEETPDDAMSDAEEAFLAEQAAAQQERLQALVDADDAFAEVSAKWTQAQHMVAQLEWRIRGLVNENAELKREIKYWRRKAEQGAAA